MDQERARIQEDLRGVVDGEVRCDDLFLQLYSSDASIYQIKPRAVIRPRHVQDVVATVQYASEHGIAVHARGAGQWSGRRITWQRTRDRFLASHATDYWF